MFLVGAVYATQLGQTGLVAQAQHRVQERLRPDPGGLEFTDEVCHDVNESGAIPDRRVVSQRKLVNDGPDQAVLYRVAEFGVGLASNAQDLGVQPVEGAHAHANRAAGLR